MPEYRLSFKKEGTARFISHLDLMRTFQRAFFRAGIPVRHTQGFNPHPVMSVAMPLPLGFSGNCEFMDFEADAAPDIEKLNMALPPGLEVMEAYEPERKFKELAYCEYEVYLRYGAVAEETAEVLDALFKTKPLIIIKKTKSGSAETDISENVISCEVTKAHDGIKLRCILTTQPYLNPQYLISAIKAYESGAMPEYADYHRKSVFDKNMNIFR